MTSPDVTCPRCGGTGALSATNYRQSEAVDDVRLLAHLLAEVAGFQDTEIAAIVGLSRERVRQYQLFMGGTLGRHRQMRETERKQAAKSWDELARRVALDRRCPVCECWNLRGDSALTCSNECASLWPTFRYRLDEGQRERHRIAMANVYLRKPDLYGPAKVEWAKRMLSDNPPPPNRRFIQKNSKAERLAQSLRKSA